MFRFSANYLLLIIAGGVFLAGCGMRAEDRPGNAGSAVETSTDAETARALERINEDPGSPAGYVGLASIHIRRARLSGDFSLNSKADAAIDRALAIAPDDPASLKLKASLHLTFHRFAEALRLGRRLEQDYPADAFVQGILTDANVELGNYDDATAAAQKMVDLKPNSAAYSRVGHLRSLHGDTAGALEMYRLAARTADPADRESQSWCLNSLGDVLRRSGRWSDAEKVYDESLTVLPDYHLALAGKARTRFAAGDKETAVTIIEKLNQRLPNAENSIFLGDLYKLTGRESDAAGQYELAEVLESSPANDDRKRLALMWADQDRRLDEALAIVKNESELRRDVFTLDALAWVLYKSGQLSEARRAAREALNLKTNDARILYHAGMIEKALGNREEAIRLLTLAVKTNPAFDPIQADIARRALAELV